MAVDLSVGGIRPIGVTDAGQGAGAASSAGQTAGANFAEALQNAASSTVGELHHAEEMSLQALAGKADIREVTDAVMSAEQHLQAAIAIRDKIVTAFLEVSRMQI